MILNIDDVLSPKRLEWSNNSETNGHRRVAKNALDLRCAVQCYDNSAIRNARADAGSLIKHLYVTARVIEQLRRPGGDDIHKGRERRRMDAAVDLYAR